MRQVEYSIDGFYVSLQSIWFIEQHSSITMMWATFVYEDPSTYRSHLLIKICLHESVYLIRCHPVQTKKLPGLNIPLLSSPFPSSLPYRFTLPLPFPVPFPFPYPIPVFMLEICFVDTCVYVCVCLSPRTLCSHFYHMLNISRRLYNALLLFDC